MPVELRKRKPREAPAPAPPPKKTSKAAKPAKVKEAAKKVEKKKIEEKHPEKDEEEVAEEVEEKIDDKKDEEEAEETKDEEPKETKGKKKSGPLEVGDVIDLDGFGGEIETNDGDKTTLKILVEESKAGVVLFTYPKASTPGCKSLLSLASILSLDSHHLYSLFLICLLLTVLGTKQVCFFRDEYEPLTADGLLIFGLSSDSPKANTTFKEKQKLQYPLLCDPKQTLISALGLKKAPKGTTRGVFVVDKEGKVLVSEAGSPQGTVDRVKALVEELKK